MECGPTDGHLNLARQAKDLSKRDAAGGIVYDTACAAVVAAAAETYQYDELQRLTQASRSWVNLPADAPAAAASTYAYDDSGNITSKPDYAGLFAYAGPRPHAVTSVSSGGVTRTSFGYDGNGDMTTSTGTDARSVAFDELERPLQIDVAGRLLGQEPAIQQWSGRRPETIVPWSMSS